MNGIYNLVIILYIGICFIRFFSFNTDDSERTIFTQLSRLYTLKKKTILKTQRYKLYIIENSYLIIYLYIKMHYLSSIIV